MPFDEIDEEDDENDEPNRVGDVCELCGVGNYKKAPKAKEGLKCDSCGHQPEDIWKEFRRQFG